MLKYFIIPGAERVPDRPLVHELEVLPDLQPARCGFVRIRAAFSAESRTIAKYIATICATWAENAHKIRESLLISFLEAVNTVFRLL